MSVLLETSLGDIVIDLLTETRPRACLNFLKLCKLKMYNFCLVHSVQRNFIIQTGNIDGKGGSSVYSILYGDQAKLFEREELPKIKHDQKYTVSMVNDGNGYHGSQFLITTTESPDVLNGVHTVFGKVVEGRDVVDEMNEAYCDSEHRPFQDIRINHTIVLHDPFPDPGLLPVPPRSPSPPPYVIDSDRLAVGETINKLAGHATEDVLEYIEEKELRANTQMLEIIGDIPDADVKPPENVLFVCKLNPVTTSDDLEIIFSRFGTIESCEVIRDWKTGDSLCYAFIEFTENADCESAYFKMDNVLIDERRIHVDFSQSVSRLYWSRNTPNQQKYTGIASKDNGPAKVKPDSGSQRLRGGNRGAPRGGYRPREERPRDYHGSRDDNRRRRSREREDQRPRDSYRSRDSERSRDRPRDRSREQPREAARPHDRSREQPREAARPHDRSREQPREADRPRDMSREQPREAARPRDRSREQPREADRPRDRSREQPREADRPRDRSREQPREDDRPRDRPRRRSRDMKEKRQDSREDRRNYSVKNQDKDQGSRIRETSPELGNENRSRNLRTEIEHLQGKIKNKKEGRGESDGSDCSSSPAKERKSKKKSKKKKKSAKLKD